MKNAPSTQETFTTIPAADGFFSLTVYEDEAGNPIADRTQIIAWIVRVSLDKSGGNPHDPLIYGELLPLTLWGVPSSGERHFILAPDGRVTEP